MNKIILLSMIFFSSFCKGQRIDTTYIGRRPQYDTVRVLLLMCDTSVWSGEKINGLGIVFWTFAYSVRELGFVITVPYPTFYWEHLYYLWPAKEPLPKNYVVWQSKELK